MNKKVRIKTVSPIPLKVVIRGNVEEIILSTEDIRRCITLKAEVDEILCDGSYLRLDFTNYNSDNNQILRDKATKKAEEDRKKIAAEEERQRKEAEAMARSKQQEEQRRIAEENRKKREEEEKAKKEESNKQSDKK